MVDKRPLQISCPVSTKSEVRESFALKASLIRNGSTSAQEAVGFNTDSQEKFLCLFEFHDVIIKVQKVRKRTTSSSFPVGNFQKLLVAFGCRPRRICTWQARC